MAAVIIKRNALVSCCGLRGVGKLMFDLEARRRNDDLVMLRELGGGMKPASSHLPPAMAV